MIHQVESLGTELHSETLSDLVCFRNAKIDLRESRATAGITRDVPVPVWRGLKSVMVQLVAGHAIVRRPNRLSGNIVRSKLVDTKKRRRQSNREGEAASRLDQTGQLPASSQQ